VINFRFYFDYYLIWYGWISCFIHNHTLFFFYQDYGKGVVLFSILPIICWFRTDRQFLNLEVFFLFFFSLMNNNTFVLHICCDLKLLYIVILVLRLRVLYIDHLICHNHCIVNPLPFFNNTQKIYESEFLMTVSLWYRTYVDSLN
jgi:hypothetical protein